MTRKTVTLAAVLIISPILASATIINIPADYPTIQQGIDASSDGDTVLVQPGTYYENINFNGHNIVLGSLFLTTGDEDFIDSTIINGNFVGTAITIASGEDSTTAIAGFTIIHGRDFNSAGGIACNNSSCTISHNIINLNSGDAGGIACNNSNCVIIHNVINNNNGTFGAIACDNSECTISYNFIKLNSGNVGGIYLSEFNGIVSNNIISDNNGQCGAMDIVLSNVVISGNFITGNTGTADSPGASGGIGITLNDQANEVIIVNNIISHNTSPCGAGIYVYMGYPLIIGNIISHNSATGTWGRGGGILVMSWHADAFIFNNTIVHNTANYEGGGVIACDWATAYIINSIIRDNQAPYWPQLLGMGPVTYSNIQGGHSGDGNIDEDPLFRDPANEDFHLMSTSCGDSANSQCIDTGDPAIFDDILSCNWGLGAIDSDMGAYGGDVYRDICGYVTGDANGDNSANGLDVGYLVGYLKGGPAPPITCDCPPHGSLRVAADVNASCSVNGLDITYMVSFYKGGPALMHCPDCPPYDPGIGSSLLKKWKALKND